MRYNEDNLTFAVGSCFLTVKPKAVEAQPETEQPGEWAVNLRQKVDAAILRDQLQLLKIMDTNR